MFYSPSLQMRSALLISHSGENTPQPVWYIIIISIPLLYETLLNPMKGYLDYKKTSNKGSAPRGALVRSSAPHPQRWSLGAIWVPVSLPLLIGHWLRGGKVCVADAESSRGLPRKLELISISCLNWALAPGESQCFRIHVKNIFILFFTEHQFNFSGNFIFNN